MWSKFVTLDEVFTVDIKYTLSWDRSFNICKFYGKQAEITVFIYNCQQHVQFHENNLEADWFTCNATNHVVMTLHENVLYINLNSALFIFTQIKLGN